MRRLSRVFVVVAMLLAALVGWGCSVSADMSSSSGGTEGASFALSELSFERDGLSIYGRLYEPAGEQAGEAPVVVICHGFASSCEDTARDAERLVAAGVTCYAFDFCGGAPQSKSDGSMLEMSVLTEMADLNAVIDGLLEEGVATEGQLYLMGESQGGLVCSLVAAERPDDVAGLALIYPALSIPDDARERFSDASEIPDEVEGLFGVTVGRTYYADVLDLDPFELIGGYEGPVLIFHGDEDDVVPVSYSECAAEVYENAELHVVEGAGHGFSDEQLDGVCEEIAGFMGA